MPEIPEVNELEEIVKKMMDAPGYVLFVGILSDDGKTVNHHYRRYHFSIEDTAATVKAFKDHAQKDSNPFNEI